MTERLASMMNAEADLLDIPTPPTGAVLNKGRRLRRQRRGAQVVAGVAVLAVIGAGVGYLQRGGDEPGAAIDPAAPGQTSSRSGLGAVFTIGTTLYLDDGSISAKIDDRAIKSLYYTSAGVLVRHGNNSYSDGGGPQRFSLVSLEGTVTPLSLTTEETVHATDPAQPYVAYAQEEDGLVSVHVRDVTTDEEVALVAVGGAGGGFYPLSLDGDQVYLGSENGVFVIDWRTGDVQKSDTLTGSSVAGGHTVDTSGTSPQVVDVATGRVLAAIEVDPDSYPYVTLSPDGTGALVNIQDPMGGAGEDGTTAYDVSSGAPATVPGPGYDYGWTADGDLFKVSGDGVLTTCVVATGACAETTLDLDVLPDTSYSTKTDQDDLVLGGVTRES